MADKTLCYVTTCQDDGPAFGVRVDNDESVYIPRSVVEDLDLAELDTIEAVIVSGDRGANNWRVLRARVVEEAGQ